MIINHIDALKWRRTFGWDRNYNL